MREAMRGVINYERRTQHNRDRLVRCLAKFSRTWEDLKDFGGFIASETGGLHVMRCSHEDVKSCVKYLKSVLDEYESLTQTLIDEYEEY